MSSMFPVPFLVYLLLQTAVYETRATNFYIEGTVKCLEEPTPNWCFRITLDELDTFSPNDRIDSFGVKCTRQDTFSYQLNGTDNGDGFDNFYYDLVVRIRHNCSSVFLQEVFQLDDIPVTDKEFIKKGFDIRLKHIGEQVESLNND